MKIAENAKCKSRYEQIAFVFAHVALFIVFVWFGFLKVIGTSPADGLVQELLTVTMPWWSFESFFIFLGILEMAIGVLFIVPKMERIAIAILIPHMITTIMPLFLLPAIAWQSFLTPTLEGQYIIKNVVIVALAVSILVDLKARKKHRRKSH